MADPMQQARELVEKLDSAAASWPTVYASDREIISLLLAAATTLESLREAALRAAPEWQPIDTAPEGRLVVVGWLDSEDSHYPENYEFDYLEDGLWVKHEDCVEHADAVAPPGSKLPKEQPPYQWWMDLPAFPAARPQGVR